MAITSAIATSFKVELLKGVHNFTADDDQFKLALYTSSASLGAATTAYTSSNEVSGTNYTAKGGFLTTVTPVASGTTALVDMVETKPAQLVTLRLFSLRQTPRLQLFV